MASAVTTQRLGARNYVETFVHVPGSASATVATPDSGTTKLWRDMRDFETFLVSAANAVLTGNGLTLLEIVAAEDSSGTNIQVVVASATLTGTAVDNGGVLECNAAQIREVAASSGKNLRWVAARLTVANSSDKVALTYVRGGAKHPQSALTPATF